MSTRIAVIPGDGIGVDVTAEAVKVLRAVADLSGDPIEIREYDFGAERYLRTGETLPPGALEELASYDAILLGAMGDPRVPDMKHAADILPRPPLQARSLRESPAGQALHDALTPLAGPDDQGHRLRGVPREHRGPLRRHGRNFKKGMKDEIAIQEDVNTYKGVERPGAMPSRSPRGPGGSRW
ncbi:MAG: isocitrate/isopropylmalate family dehydrogenase [Acidobacteriota bacterium]